MVDLIAAVHKEHKTYFFKGAILSNDTLKMMGFQDYTEVVQEPMQVMCSHSYHCGLGMKKLAVAHSWFSRSWFMLNVSLGAELPVSMDMAIPDGWEPTVGLVNGEPYRGKRESAVARRRTKDDDEEGRPASKKARADDA